jgi:hypothetical protein
MKSIEITFFTWARCVKEIEVDDDYQLPSSNSEEFWQDILEKYPEYDESDFMCDTISSMEGCYDDFDIEQMGLDYIHSITIKDDAGNEILEKTFDKIQYS